MKTLFFITIFLAQSFLLKAQTAADTQEISFVGNGYLYGNEGRGSWRMIGDDGLRNWKDDNSSVRIYFFPTEKGVIDIAIKMKSPIGTSEVAVALDGDGHWLPIKVLQSNDFISYQIGSFNITTPEYHYLEIKPVKKSGDFYPQINGLEISGPEASAVRYNKSTYRGAPSTHLRFPYPKDSTIAWFYTEVKVPVGVDATNAYYMTNGFRDGYMGIQLNSKTERRFIFSVWSNFNTDDPKEIPADYAVTLLKKGKNVVAEPFGNEGSGGHSHIVFPWKNGEIYKFLLGAKPNGDHTIFTAYYKTPEDKDWQLFAQWDKTKTGGKLLSNLYSFLENFGSNGNDYFKADYGNQWVCTENGTWIELTNAFLTTTASPTKHQRYDFGDGVEDNMFYMFSGGFNDPRMDIQHFDKIERKANGVHPEIIFNKLPEE